MKRYPHTHISTVNDNSPVSAIAFSSDGKYLASVAEDGGKILYVNDISSTTNEVATVETNPFDHCMNCIAFSPGCIFVAAAAGSDNAISFFHDGKWVQSHDPISTRNNPVHTLSFSRSGKWLLIGGGGGSDNSISSVSTNSFCYILERFKDTYKVHRKLNELEVRGAQIKASSFSTTNENVVALSCNKVVKRYDITDEGKWLMDFPQSQSINAIQYSPCGQYLSIGSECKFKTYHILTQSLICERKHDGEVVSICYSSYNHCIIVGDHVKSTDEGYVTFYDIYTRNVVYKFKMNGPIESIGAAQSLRSTKIAILCNSMSIIYDMKEFRNTTLNKFSQENDVYTSTYSPDGSKLVYSQFDGNRRKLLQTLRKSNLLKVFNKKDNTMKDDILEEYEPITTLVYSIDGKRLVGGSLGKLYVFDAENKYDIVDVQEKGKLGIDYEQINSIKFSVDGKLIAIGCEDSGLKVYSFPSFHELRTPSQLTSGRRVTSLDFGGIEDGNVIAFGSENKVTVINLSDDTITEVKEYIHDGLIVETVVYSPNKMLIAYAGKGSRKVYVRRSKNHDLIREVEVDNATDISCISFSCDNQILAIGSYNGIVKFVYSEDSGSTLGLNTQSISFSSIIHSADNGVSTAWKPFGAPIYFASNECINAISFRRAKNDCSGDPLVLHEDRFSDEVFYEVAISYGKTVMEIRAHKFMTLSTTNLVENYSDEQILEVLQDVRNNITPFTRTYGNSHDGNTLYQIAWEMGRFGLTTDILRHNGNVALTDGANFGYEENLRRKFYQYQGRILKKMVDRYLVDNLNEVISSMTASISLNVIQDLYYLLRDLAGKNLTSTAKKLLNAKISGEGEYQGIECPDGFFIINTFYAERRQHDTMLWKGVLMLRAFLSRLSWCKHLSPKDTRLVPIANEQKPRASSDIFDLRSKCWGDLAPDPKKNVKLYILLVYLPNLGSFECLKTLTSMKSTKLFDSRPIHAVLDAVWENFAKKFFFFQLFIYIVFLICFTSFCEITKFHVYRMQVMHELDYSCPYPCADEGVSAGSKCTTSRRMQDLSHDRTEKEDSLLDIKWPVIVYVLAGFVLVGLFWFVCVEINQGQKSSWKYYVTKNLNPIHFTKRWNLWQWFSILLVLATVVLRLMQGWSWFQPSLTLESTQLDSELCIAVVSAFALIFTWVGLFSYLRGFERFAWIITALGRILMSLVSFILVLILIIVSFTVVFRALYNGKNVDRTDSDYIDKAKDLGWCLIQDHEPLDAYVRTESKFGSLNHSFATTFMAAMIGHFEFDDFELSHARYMSLFFLNLMLLIILIIALNALIAFISERFELVLNEKNAALKYQKAEIIMDMYCLPRFILRRDQADIEKENRWTSIVVPAASLAEGNDSNPLVNMSRATKDDSNQIKKIVMNVQKEALKLHEEMEKKVDKVKDNVEQIEKDVRQIKEDLTLIKNILISMSTDDVSKPK